MDPRRDNYPISYKFAAGEFHLEQVVSPTFSDYTAFTGLIFASKCDRTVARSIAKVLPGMVEVFLV